MKDMNRLKDMLCEELEEFARKEKMSAGDLQTIHMLTDTIKNIDKIGMLEDEESEYSQARRRDARGRYARDGRDYESYDDGESYARRGKHYVRGHYSRNDGKERVMEILDRMMDGAQGADRQAIQRMMDIAREI